MRRRATWATDCLAALEAAEREGGDIRGRQSAALVVVAPRGDRAADGGPPDRPARGRSRRPGRRAAAAGRAAQGLPARGGRRRARRGRRPRRGAGRVRSRARASSRDNAELAFWHGVTLAANGREAEARELLERAYAEREGWRELLRRLPASGLFPDDQELIGSTMTRPAPSGVPRQGEDLRPRRRGGQRGRLLPSRGARAQGRARRRRRRARRGRGDRGRPVAARPRRVPARLALQVPARRSRPGRQQARRDARAAGGARAGRAPWWSTPSAATAGT